MLVLSWQLKLWRTYEIIIWECLGPTKTLKWPCRWHCPTNRKPRQYPTRPPVDGTRSIKAWTTSLLVENKDWEPCRRPQLQWPHYKRPASISGNCSQGSVLTSDSNSHDELHCWISTASFNIYRMNFDRNPSALNIPLRSTSTFAAYYLSCYMVARPGLWQRLTGRNWNLSIQATCVRSWA